MRDRSPRIGWLAAAALITASAVSLAGGCSGRSITIPTNQPPSVSASGTPINGNPPLTVAFAASASDPDGRVVGYFWDFGDGGSSIEQNPVHTFTTIGFYRATVTARDEWGASATREVTVNVSPNTRPVANAGPDQFYRDPGATVALDGTGSSDPDGQPLAYSWRQTAGLGVGLSGASSPTPSFASSGASTSLYRFELTVTDNGNPQLSSTDEVEVATRWTWNNRAAGIIGARCAVSGCHNGSNAARTTLNTYAEVFGSRFTVSAKVDNVAPSSMRGYGVGSEADQLVEWINAGAPLSN